MHPRNPSTHLLSILLTLVAGFLAASPAHAQAPASPCAADLTDDDVVDANDLGMVLAGWGDCGKSCSADIDGDGAVTGEDMAAVLNFWGMTCPRITGISPVAGPPFGGNTVTITGTHLGGVTEVWIGDEQAHKVALVDENTVTAVVPSSQPAGSTGPRTVRLVADGGESSLASGYTYVKPGLPPAPWVDSVSPQTVSAAGGDLITITGADFVGATAVLVDGVSASFTVFSGSLIYATAPAHAPGGMFDVAVTNPTGTSTARRTIAYWQSPSWPCTVLEAAPDPAVVYDPQLRTAILTTGLPWRIRESAVGIEMVLIPNGTFWMGCTISSDMEYCPNEETPNHTVTLSKPFYLGRYEVMQHEWQTRTGINPSHFTSASAQVPADQVPNRPADSVSWNMIVDDFQPGTGLRLPTEAEWEYACRAGTETAYHGWATMPQGFTDVSLVGNIGWSNTNSNNQTHPVGLLQPNGFGLYDMSGNVSEWCADRYSASYYSQSPLVDPPGASYTQASNEDRVLRGGPWGSSGNNLRSSSRAGDIPGILSNYYGFRVARTP
jgi:formylglycine-generating enzyme required for sulfatase activity